MGAPQLKKKLEESHEPESHHDESLALLHDDHGPAHQDSEGVWLISYADMMTLLMGFFALMTSMATFETEVFEKVGSETAEFFGGEVEQPYQELAEALKKVIDEKNLADQVQTSVQKTGITLTFEGTLFFDSGSIKLKEGATLLMREIVTILDDQASSKKFLVEGHTDDVPIQQGLLASNWELSALRAGAVARLFEDKGFQRDQIMTIGLGETRPLVNNRDPNGHPILEHQAKNRRVVLKIMDKLPL